MTVITHIRLFPSFSPPYDPKGKGSSSHLSDEEAEAGQGRRLALGHQERLELLGVEMKRTRHPILVEHPTSLFIFVCYSALNPQKVLNDEALSANSNQVSVQFGFHSFFWGRPDSINVFPLGFLRTDTLLFASDSAANKGTQGSAWHIRVAV